MKTSLRKRATSLFLKKIGLLVCGISLLINTYAGDRKEFNTNNFLSNAGYKASDYIRSMDETVMAETLLDPVTGEYHAIVTKLDINGGKLWQKDYILNSGPGISFKGIRVTGVKVLQSTTIAVVGVTQRFSAAGFYNQVFLLRLSAANGNYSGYFEYNTNVNFSWDKATVTELTSGDLIIATSTSNNSTFGFLKVATSGLVTIKTYNIARSFASLDDLHPYGTDFIAVGSAGHANDYNGGMAVRFNSNLDVVWAYNYITPLNPGSSPSIYPGANSLFNPPANRSNLALKAIAEGNKPSPFMDETIRIAGYSHNSNSVGAGSTFTTAFTADINPSGSIMNESLHNFNTNYSAIYDIDAFDKTAGGPAGTYTTDWVFSGMVDFNTSSAKSMFGWQNLYSTFNSGYASGLYNVFGRSTMELVNVAPPTYQRFAQATGTGCGQSTISSSNKAYWANGSTFLMGGTCTPFNTHSSQSITCWRSGLTLNLLNTSYIGASFSLTPANPQVIIDLTSQCSDPCNSITFNVSQSGSSIITTLSVADGINFSYNINYGDGSPTIIYLGPYSIPGNATSSYTYGETGTFNVCVTVTIQTENGPLVCTKCVTVNINSLLVKQDDKPTEDQFNEDQGGLGSNLSKNIRINKPVKPSSSEGIKNISESESSVTVYPHPANSTVNISFRNHEQENVTIGIYNLTGQLVKQIISDKTFSKGNNMESCDMSEFAAGMYYFKIESKSFNIVKPIVKQ